MIESSPLRPTDPVDADTLAGALDMERGLLAELGGILRRQREGVATDDIDVVDASVFSVNRVIHTLGEARRRRMAMLAILGGSADTPLEELEHVLGPGIRPEVIVARERLWTEAAGVAREIEVNRRVLRHVMQDRNRLVRGMCVPPSAPTIEREWGQPRREADPGDPVPERVFGGYPGGDRSR